MLPATVSAVRVPLTSGIVDVRGLASTSTRAPAGTRISRSEFTRVGVALDLEVDRMRRDVPPQLQPLGAVAQRARDRDLRLVPSEIFSVPPAPSISTTRVRRRLTARVLALAPPVSPGAPQQRQHHPLAQHLSLPSCAAFLRS